MENRNDVDLLAYCKDLDEWPRRWENYPEDVFYGKEILEVFKPFMRSLIAQGLSRKTIRNHIDNLWLLGGELIRSLSRDKSLRNVPPDKLVADSVDEQGGPLCYHLHTEHEQAVFDSTCRKLHKFLKSKA